MDTASPCKPSERPLYTWEITEARRVFQDQLKYERVRIHECTSWPNAANSIGMKLKRIPGEPAPNAVTIGNHCYFPVRLVENLVGPEDGNFYKICWLMHELTHVWQYQHLGWRYLALALSAQFRETSKAYDFGGQSGLLERLKEGWTIKNFNPEQQGDIVRSYYEQLCTHQDTTAWDPFIQQFQQAA